jgi:hypothetical protein|tara:strand:+ start:353 stop:568 length:216 start_codon:yes stop_codon:yes gene_type:complete
MKKLLILFSICLISCSDSESCDSNEKQDLINRFNTRIEAAGDDLVLSDFLRREFLLEVEKIGCVYDEDLLD